MKGKRYIKELMNDIKKRITAESKNEYHPDIKNTFFWKLDKIEKGYKNGLITEIDAVKEIVKTYEIFRDMPER